MVEIPINAATQADLEQWYQLKAQLKNLTAMEGALRRRIFGTYFREPKEGANTFILPDGYQLKATHVINRSVDDAALTVNKDRYAKMGIAIDKLVRRKPELAVAAYRELTDEQRHAFDESLTIKEGSPQLEIAPPSKRATKG